MIQQEIEFFWPLTEQIPLPLDYTECNMKMKITGGLLSIQNGSGSLWTTSNNIRVADVATNGITINGGSITINGLHMPWYRKLVFKLIGFNWNA